MSSSLSEIEELRLFNLKLLHGTVSKCIAPTSEQLVDAFSTAGVPISASTLSNIYNRKTFITDNIAYDIERALKMPDGWLSTDHSSWLTTSREDSVLIQLVLTLPSESKLHLASFLQNLNEKTQENADPISIPRADGPE